MDNKEKMQKMLSIAAEIQVWGEVVRNIELREEQLKEMIKKGNSYGENSIGEKILPHYILSITGYGGSVSIPKEIGVEILEYAKKKLNLLQEMFKDI